MYVCMYIATNRLIDLFITTIKRSERGRNFFYVFVTSIFIMNKPMGLSVAVIFFITKHILHTHAYIYIYIYMTCK